MQIIKSINKNYPKRLLELKNHPVVLYVEGNPEILNNNSIAIVGSRDNSEYGGNQAKRFSTYLAEHKITIVSGLASGIDTIAHISSYDKIGKTIAVIASGFKHIYPSSNFELANKIIEEGGCIVSEYPPETEVDMQRFPKRNKIISAISQGVLVIESKFRSGSNITAREAFKQKKEVYCIPGNLDSNRSWGTNHLIQQGASLVMSPIEIYNELIEEENDEKPIIENMDAISKEIYKYIGKLPITIDEISRKSNISISEISEKLFIMELEGKIKNTIGNQYVIT